MKSQMSFARTAQSLNQFIDSVWKHSRLLQWQAHEIDVEMIYFPHFYHLKEVIFLANNRYVNATTWFSEKLSQMRTDPLSNFGLNQQGPFVLLMQWLKNIKTAC